MVSVFVFFLFVFVFQAEDGIRDRVRSRGLGDVYKRQVVHHQHEEHGHQDQHQRGAGLRLPGVAQVVLDLVAHHLGARRAAGEVGVGVCLLYTSPSPRDRTRSRMPSSA